MFIPHMLWTDCNWLPQSYLLLHLLVVSELSVKRLLNPDVFDILQKSVLIKASYCMFTKTLKYVFFSLGFSAAKGRSHRGAGGGLAWKRTDHGRERNGVGARGICSCKRWETGEKHQTQVRWSSRVITYALALSFSFLSLIYSHLCVSFLDFFVACCSLVFFSYIQISFVW